MKITFEGKTYTLTQDAYYSNGNEGRYQASALDEDGNTYMVLWRILDGHEDDDNEDTMCDWDNPFAVELTESLSSEGGYHND